MKLLLALGVLVFGCSLEKNMIACGFQSPLPSDMLVHVFQISDEPVSFFLKKDETSIVAVSNSGYIKFLNLALDQEFFSGHCLDGLEDDSSEEALKVEPEKKEVISRFYEERILPVCAIFHEKDGAFSESPLFPFKIVLRDGSILRWDPVSKLCTKVHGGDHDRYTCALELHDGRIALASEECCIKIIDLNSDAQEPRVIGTHDNDITSLVEYDEKLLASSSDDGTVKVWDVDAGECFYVFDEKSAGEIVSLIKLSQGRLAFGLGNGFVVVWNPKIGSVVSFKGQSDAITCLMQLSEKNLAIASTDGLINIQDISSQKTLLSLQDSPGIQGLFPLQNGRFISSDLLGNISMWDINQVRDFQISEFCRQISGQCVIL